jgi:cell division septation protein DedD
MFRKTIIVIFLLLAITLAGCATGTSTDQKDRDLLITQSLETVEAMLTLTATGEAKVEATGEPTATKTPKATVTPSPVPSSTPTRIQSPNQAPAAAANTVSQTECDVAGFISDVTIPDGTEFAAGDSFTKTWKFRNDGTCTWDSDYLLVFKSGDKMDGPSTQQLMDDDDTVAPGETIKVSVDLVAPDDEGTYTGYWMLRNDSGENFGIGTAKSKFSVEIEVVEATETDTPTPTETDEETETPTPSSTPTTAATNTPTPVPTATAQPADTAIPTAASLSTGMRATASGLSSKEQYFS